MHDYTPKEALRLLQARVETASRDLAERIRLAINAGQPELKPVVESSHSRRGPKPKRQYWQTVPYSDEGALQVALAVLESHLVETRLFVEAAAKDFAQAGESPPKPTKEPAKGRPATSSFDELFQPRSRVESRDREALLVSNIGIRKQLVVEAESEQVLEKRRADDLALAGSPEEEIQSLQGIFGKLAELIDFEEGHRGDAR